MTFQKMNRLLRDYPWLWAISHTWDFRQISLLVTQMSRIASGLAWTNCLHLITARGSVIQLIENCWIVTRHEDSLLDPTTVKITKISGGRAQKLWQRIIPYVEPDQSITHLVFSCPMESRVAPGLIEPDDRRRFIIVGGRWNGEDIREHLLAAAR